MVNSPSLQQQHTVAASDAPQLAAVASHTAPSNAGGAQQLSGTGLDPAVIAALLGQDASNGAAAMDTAAPNAAGNSLSTSQLEVVEGDRFKLVVVLDSIDPADILSQQVSRPDIGPGASCLLRDALSSPDASVPTLRSALNDACTSAMFASLDMSRATLDAIDEYRHVALALLDEIEQRSSVNLSRHGKRTKREDAEGDLEALSLKPPPAKKFMLHRTVGPAQSIDLFTSAANLSDADLAHLASAPDTDLISVLPSSVNASSSEPAPTLGVVNPRPALPRRAVPPEAHDVQMLYYDPFSSFAPSYDSGNANAAVSESTRRTLARSRIREWDEAEDLRTVSSPMPPLPTASMDSRLDLTDEDRATLAELGADPATFEESWSEMEKDSAISSRLERNALWIAELMRGRWKRLREMEARKIADAAAEDSTTNVTSNEVKERELEAARNLLSSFSSMLALRPRATSSLSKSAASPLPPTSALHAFVPRLMASMEREPSYGGTLDAGDAKAVRDSEMLGRQAQMQNMAMEFDFDGMGYGQGDGGTTGHDIAV